MPPRSKKAAKNFDVLIVGGGLSGSALACLLGTKGFRVGCIDRDKPARQLDENFDGRTTAISWGSHNILDNAGVWDVLKKEACPIRSIDILDGGSPVLLNFSSDEVGHHPFGWIVDNRVLRHALFAGMADLSCVSHYAPAHIETMTQQDKNITITLTGGIQLSAPLVVAADGRESTVRDWAGIGTRKWSYHQRAIVCTVTHENPHNNLAIEHFRAAGPFAILPMTDGPQGEHRSSIVWTEDGPQAHSALFYQQDIFDIALSARFPDHYGAVRQIGKRFSFPLQLQHAHSYHAPRVALVADAAHGIHPIAGQGLNLGFRDIDVLVKVLGEARDSGDDLGGDAVLEHYERARRVDNMAMAGATDILNRLFSTDIPGLSPIRQTGLKLVSRIKPIKKFFMHQAMGQKAR